MAAESTAETVARRLREGIISGELAPLTRLTETSLAKQFEVSRIPVREALRFLEAEGLVESRAYSGSMVAHSPVEDAEDLFDIRIVLEAATARRAAERSAASHSSGKAKEDLWLAARKEINEVLELGEAAIAADHFEDLAALNMRFHYAVAQMSGSSSLLRLLKQISGKIEWLYSLNVTQRGPGAWPEHRAIVAAIDAGLADEASQRMEQHVRRSKESYLELLKGAE